MRNDDPPPDVIAHPTSAMTNELQIHLSLSDLQPLHLCSAGTLSNTHHTSYKVPSPISNPFRTAYRRSNPSIDPSLRFNKFNSIPIVGGRAVVGL